MSQSGSERSDAIGVIRQKRGPVYVEWHIENYFSNSGRDRCLNSPNFLVCDETWWCLQLYPNAYIRKIPHISFYLKKAPSDEKYDVTFKLGMMKSNGVEFHTVDYNHSFQKSEVRHGSSKFLLRSDLLKTSDVLSSDGVLKVFCFIRFADNTVMETAFGAHTQRSLDTMTHNFKDLYLGGRLSDVTLTVKDKDFLAHKSILLARSPVFAALLEHDKEQERSNIDNTTDCDPNSFEEFLLYLYTGKLENVLPSNVFGLYKTAKKYDVNELKEECVQLMKQNMCIDTFSDTFIFAVKYKESELLKFKTKFFVENGEKILPTTIWQLFMAKNPGLANELFMKLHNIEPVTGT